jgi:hypothetical protein
MIKPRNCTLASGPYGYQQAPITRSTRPGSHASSSNIWTEIGPKHAVPAQPLITGSR